MFVFHKLARTFSLFLSGFICLLLFTSFINPWTFTDDCPLPLFSVGGGHLHAGDHSGGLLQAEFKFGKYFWRVVRPQAMVSVSKNRSVFAGVGIGLELYVTEHLLIIPNFAPGIYFKGRGRDLGCPLEFRSGAELVYEFNNKVRIGAEVFHLSNAHLGHKNPGCNAFIAFIAFPLTNFAFYRQ